MAEVDQLIKLVALDPHTLVVAEVVLEDHLEDQALQMDLATLVVVVEEVLNQDQNPDKLVEMVALE